VPALKRSKRRWTTSARALRRSSGAKDDPSPGVVLRSTMRRANGARWPLNGGAARWRIKVRRAAARARRMTSFVQAAGTVATTEVCHDGCELSSSCAALVSFLRPGATAWAACAHRGAMRAAGARRRCAAQRALTTAPRGLTARPR
jgi:hypothetical protein